MLGVSYGVSKRAFRGTFVYFRNENQRAIRPTKELRTRCILLTYTVWSHLGLNQGLPDYESGALTN